MKKKHSFTLLEIMIVIFLIGLIGSIIGYNMKGSLEEGKAFKTEQAALKLQDLFELEIAKGATPEQIEGDPESYLQATGLVKDPGKLLRDGWGNRFNLVVDGNDIVISSDQLNAYHQRKGTLRGNDEG